MLLPGKIQQVLCLGNLTTSPSTRKFLQSLSPDFQEVKGAFDNDPKLSISHTVKHDDLKIGVLSGITIVPKNDPLSLLNEARKMDVDILIWGGTHRVEAYTLDDKLFVNPGSATGAFTTVELDDDEDEEDEDEEDEEDAEEHRDDTTQEARNNGSTHQVKQETNNKDAEGSQKENNQQAGASDQLREDGTAEHDEAEDGKDQSETQKKIDEKNSDRTVSSENKTNEEEKNSKGSEKANSSDELQGEIEKLKKEVLTTDEDDLLDDPIPSFCLLDIQGSVCTLYIYTYLDDDIKVDKVTYRK